MPLETTGTLVVIQGTSFCNINCSYCYLPDREIVARMGPHILEWVFRRTFSSTIITDPITFLWHAGEPLAVPITYFEDALALGENVNRSFNRSFTYTVQTNAMLLTDEWISLFKRHKVIIGVSIDGPEFIHDRHRVDRYGAGTHARVMKGLAKLRDAAIPFSIIAVLTDYSISYPDAIFEFFVQNSFFEIGFNIEELTGVHDTSSLAGSDKEERVRQFFARFLDLVQCSGLPFRIREFMKAYATIMAFPAETRRNSTNIPSEIFTVDVNGDFSTFCPELRGAKSASYADFVMGNVVRDTFESILTNPVFLKINREVAAGVEACRRTCDYWFTCGGGSPSNKYFETGRFDTTETMSCCLHKKAVADVVIEHVEARLASVTNPS